MADKLVRQMPPRQGFRDDYYGRTFWIGEKIKFVFLFQFSSLLNLCGVLVLLFCKKSLSELRNFINPICFSNK